MWNNFYPRPKHRKLVNKWLVIITAVFFSGCTAFGLWSPLKEGTYKDRSRGFSATVPAGWMRLNQSKEFLITKDGVALNYITVERRKADKKLEFTKKTFSADMTPQDLAEVEIDNFKANDNMREFELRQNEPAALSGHPAYRIEYLSTTPEGLKLEGIQYGFLKEEWVYRIQYEAARQHYFAKYLEDFKGFIESFHLLK
jgi:hypothetical protein